MCANKLNEDYMFFNVYLSMFEFKNSCLDIKESEL